MREILYFVLISFWVFGLAVAKGFWMTTVCIIPIVAYVVAAEWILQAFR